MVPKRIHADDLELVLHATLPLWEPMRSEQILITGGTGFFGCWLLETFCHINRVLSLDARATVLTRSAKLFRTKAPHLALDSGVTLLEGDVRSFTFPRGRFKFVIHAATEASARQAAEAPLEMLATIFSGTQRTLEFAASHETSRFLLTSSGAVYGKQPSTITHLPETYSGAPNSLDPSSVYAEGKRGAELLCALFEKQYGMQCAIARCWAFCGAYLPLDAHFAIGNFIGDVLAKRPIQIAGDGTPRRSYLYAADLAVWLWTMLFTAPALVPINVGSSHDVSIFELAATVAKVMDPGISIQLARKPVEGAEIARYVPSVACAGKLLGLDQTVSLAEMIRRTALWHRQEHQVLMPGGLG